MKAKFIFLGVSLIIFLLIFILANKLNVNFITFSFREDGSGAISDNLESSNEELNYNGVKNGYISTEEAQMSSSDENFYEQPPISAGSIGMNASEDVQPPTPEEMFEDYEAPKNVTPSNFTFPK